VREREREREGERERERERDRERERERGREREREGESERERGRVRERVVELRCGSWWCPKARPCLCGSAHPVGRGSTPAEPHIIPATQVHHMDDQHHRSLAAAAAASPLTPPSLVAANWYLTHLHPQLPVVVLSDELAVASEGGQWPSLAAAGVRVMRAAEYFLAAWPHVPAVQQLYGALAAKEADKEAENVAEGGGPGEAKKRSAFR
jgi:hypothetical protein